MLLLRPVLGFATVLLVLLVLPQPAEGAHPTQLRLPWPAGDTHQITKFQLTYDCGSHGSHPTNKKAIDFKFATNEEVGAAASGTIVDGSVSPDDGRGNFLEIDHGGNHRTRYLHLRTNAQGGPWAPGIAIGEYVSQGQHIGYSGATGDADGPHLHFDLKRYASGLPVEAIVPEPMSGEGDFGDYGVCPVEDSPLWSSDMPFTGDDSVGVFRAGENYLRNSLSSGPP